MLPQPDRAAHLRKAALISISGLLQATQHSQSGHQATVTQTGNLEIALVSSAAGFEIQRNVKGYRTWQAIADDSTRMALRNRGEPAGFSSLAAPFMAIAIRRANRKDLGNLRAILEAA